MLWVVSIEVFEAAGHPSALVHRRCCSGAIRLAGLWRGIAATSLKREVDDAEAAEDQAVDGEGGEGAGLEIADEVPHGQVGGDGGDHDAEDDLAVDVGAGGPGEGGGLEGPGGPERRGGGREGGPGRALVGPAPPHTPPRWEP